jgi:RNA recognition motif-containing protein
MFDQTSSFDALNSLNNENNIIDSIFDGPGSNVNSSKLGSFRLFKPTVERKSAVSDLHGFNRQPIDLAPLRTRLGNLSINTGSINSSMNSQYNIPSPISTLNSAIPSAPGLTIQMATTRSINSNDQNPPCNTLYVGNLSVSTKEEELRKLFQTAYGFKRMCFKTKQKSGPMCFVEFKDTSCAALALREFDGRMLSTSSNGGIRLSYSKNPLGVRSANSMNNPNLSASADPPKGYKSFDLNTDGTTSSESSIESSGFVNSLAPQGDMSFPFTPSNLRDKDSYSSLNSSMGYHSMFTNGINSVNSVNHPYISLKSTSQSIETSPISSNGTTVQPSSLTQSNF